MGDAERCSVQPGDDDRRGDQPADAIVEFEEELGFSERNNNAKGVLAIIIPSRWLACIHPQGTSPVVAVSAVSMLAALFLAAASSQGWLPGPSGHGGLLPALRPPRAKPPVAEAACCVASH